MADVPGANSISEVFERVRAEGRTELLEPEGYALARHLGIATPAHVFVTGRGEAESANLSSITTGFVVLKVVSAEIPHKSDLGGVRTVPNDRETIIEAIDQMERRLAGHRISGYLVNEFLPHSEALGGQLLLGLRWTSDFGPVVTASPGGTRAEWLAQNLECGGGVAVFAPCLGGSDRIERGLTQRGFVDLATGNVRGGAKHFEPDTLVGLTKRFLALAESPDAAAIEEFEINPVVPSARGPVALDVLGRLRTDSDIPAPPRPLRKLSALLKPRSIAILGVSERLNPGRVILQNTLRTGFPPEKLHVVKSGASEIDGVLCYPDIALLPTTVDLLVLSIAAPQVPDTVADIVTGRRAESIIVIPGGLGERAGTSDLANRIKDVLQASRSTDWQGPVVNGGNCLGVFSAPGRYDTTFIPDYKLPADGGETLPLTIISQSGAFGVSRLSKLPGHRPRYSISVGNQIDLTVGDYLTYLKDDPEVEVFACYVEAFRPLDGSQWLEAAQDITASGRHVVLYRAGRTAAGAQATQSHTAAVAGDYTVARRLAEAAGVVVAESLEDFDDLVRLFCYLRGKRVGGLRLGAVSNAGFECVAAADNLGNFELAPLTERTVQRLETCFERSRIEDIVFAQNPVDLTPITNDEVYEDVVRGIMSDETVDIGVVGCVPLTPALQTLTPGPGHRENLDNEDSIVTRLARMKEDIEKPWVAVVDAGPQYEPMRTKLLERGVPTFRTVDRALRLFGVYCRRMMDTWQLPT